LGRSERNVAIHYEVKRRITDSRGNRFNADMIGVTANAASSIALRNAILKGIPKALWVQMYETARKTIMGDFQTLANRRATTLQNFQKFGVTAERVFEKLGIRGEEDITLEHIVTLRGLLTALRDGDTTVEDAFGKTAGVDMPKSKKEQDAAAAAAVASTDKAGSTPAQSQRSGETGAGFESSEVLSGETKARAASPDSAAAESGAQSNDSPPMRPSQVNVIRAKLKAAARTEVDLEAKYPGKSLEPKDGKQQFTVADFGVIQAWISEAQ
jgi:hypothetical protein